MVLMDVGSARRSKTASGACAINDDAAWAAKARAKRKRLQNEFMRIVQARFKARRTHAVPRATQTR